MPVALMDILAGHQLKEGLLLALLERIHSGKGKLVGVSLIQSAIASLANQASNWLVAGIMPEKAGSAHPNIAPYGETFLTADGYEILLAVGTDSQFSALCKILSPFAEPEPLFVNNAGRVANRAQLNERLSRSIKIYRLEFLEDQLRRQNIPYGLVRNMRDVFESEYGKAILLKADDRTGVKTFVGQPDLKVNSHFLPPPHFGEHTEEILVNILKMPKEAVSRLKNIRAIA